VVAFPACLKPVLQHQLAVAKAVAATDQPQHLPVPLPDRLAAKYPRAAYSERWAWLFPAHGTCLHPRTNLRVRWRCHAASVQRTVKSAALLCRLDGLTPHHLRHAFATHSLHHGAFVRDLQVVLGHNNLETTMRYLHAEASRVASPLQTYVP
jgi:integrase